jgi:bacillithiol biosynthesis cysteine-adding enzyme BshC
MIKLSLPYSDTNCFSSLVSDYLNQSDSLSPFYKNHLSSSAFAKQIAERKEFAVNRKLLQQVMQEQYATFKLSPKAKENLDSLSSAQTFTVTTGHQLCLFTGPLYFIFKIVSTIKLANELKQQHPDHHFVPVFWMATEDHDFEEIKSINLFAKKLSWEREAAGAVGRMSLEGMEPLLADLSAVLGEGKEADSLMQLFKRAYLEQENLADATRYLVNELFAKYGLLILDADEPSLKKEALSLMKRDMLEQKLAPKIRECSLALAEQYKAQAYVRDINFFKLTEGGRTRVEGCVSEEEIEKHPENFSPNVLMRPLYQEMIMPNVAYVGGGAELAYWMQLKTVFEQENILMPVLVLRNSALWMEKKELNKWESLGFSLPDIFLDEHLLQQKYIDGQSTIDITPEVHALKSVFDQLLAKTTDKGLQSSILAEQQKQLHSLDRLEKKLYKTEKSKHEIALRQISRFKEKFFPNNGLQERYDNFIPYYLKHGENFVETLMQELSPLDTKFLILSPE